jgi:hypothetical protein
MTAGLFRKIIALVCALVNAQALAIDLLPNDAVAPPPDLSFATVFYQNLKYNDWYVNNQKSISNPSMNIDLGGVRLARSYNVGSYPGITYVQVSAGGAQSTGSAALSGNDSGLTDTAIATAIWPYANHETRSYFGLAGYVFLPTGSYDKTHPINLGENRYKADLQIGYQTQFTANLAGMLAFDTMWFGANDQANGKNDRLTQKPLYTSQLGPIYRFNRIFTLGVNYLYIVGGEPSVNGQAQNRMVQTQRYYATLLAHLPVGRIAVQYGNDIETRNGFQESRRFQVRFTHVF